LYGGTNRYLNKCASKHGVEFTIVDARNPQNVRDAPRENTKLVWLETPTNPLLRVADIEAISTLVHDYNKDIVVVVDNTFLTPYNQVILNSGIQINILLSNILQQYIDIANINIENRIDLYP